MINDSAD